MSEIQEHVAHLSQSIGPRPAGTEEEQQAALYVAERLQRDAELPVEVEDFNCNPQPEIVRTVCCAATLLLGVCALIAPVMVIPALLVSLAAAAVFVLDALGKSPFRDMFKTGVSQNVVAKYQPAPRADSPSPRRRKVILVAHYDTGKVRRDLAGPVVAALPVLRWVELGAMVAVPVVMLIRFITTAEGPLLTFLSLLTVVALVLSALPIAAFAVGKFSAFNEGANCNAAGVSVLMEVAARIGRGRVSEDELADVALHGEEAALDSGYLPEGAQLVYAAPAAPADPMPVADESPEARLMAAKAAVAAISGKPVSDSINIDLADNLVQIEEPPVIIQSDEAMREVREETMDAFENVDPAELAAGAGAVIATVAAATATAAAPVIVEEPAASAVPSWFKSAQEKARKTEEKEAPVQRSRYADALDAAQNSARQQEEAAVFDTEARLAQMRNDIMGVKAPSFDDEAEVPEQQPRPHQEFAGIDGFLANATAKSEYHVPILAPMQEQQPAQPQPAKPEAAPAAPEERSSVMDRTIAFIPVAIDDVHPTEPSAAADQSAALDALYGASPAPQAVESSAPSAHRRRAIDLPSLTGSLEPLSEGHKQAAPLADGSASNSDRIRNLRASVPSIGDLSTASASPAEAADIRHASLRDSLPSIGAAAAAAPVFAEEEPSSVSQAGAFASVGATGAFAPVGEELIEDVDPEEMYVDDVDDSAYESDFTETGAYAGPGYVEMPKSRASRIFSKFKFGRKKEQEESTPQQWLDVDDDFDARSVGRARGGWESFRQDDDQLDSTQMFNAVAGDEYYDDYEDGYDDGYSDTYDDGYDQPAPRGSRPWNGGAFSRSLLDKAGVRRAEEDARAPEGSRSGLPRITGDRELLDELYAEPAAPSEAADLAELHPENVQRIYGFRHPEIDTEVWFVALGAELAGGAGMQAFMAEHAEDMRGAIVVELEGLGAGKLTLIEKEGMYRAVKSSSRMKRFTRKAASALGMNVPSADMCWKNGSAVYAARAGAQTMHLAGMDGAKPACFGEAGDTVDNVDENTMLMNADFVMELLKSI